uniref:Uncharacterized protein n=1 Tax=Rhizophora mucronata TaxID=61149 RepID=A0A2P2PVR6_RHIMU
MNLNTDANLSTKSIYNSPTFTHSIQFESSPISIVELPFPKFHLELNKNFIKQDQAHTSNMLI